MIAAAAAVAADAVVIVADAFHAPRDIEKNIIEQVVANKLPAILVLNKVDMSNPEKLALTIAQYDEIHKFVTVGDVVNYLSEVVGE